MKHRILVMGAGAWGTALALHAARTGAQVYLWARNPARLPSGAMPRLPDFPLPDSITVSSAPPPADVACALMVIPTQHMASVLPLVPAGVPAVLCCKGIERSTLAFPLDVLHRLRPDVPGAVLSGPNFAREVAADLPAASVVASANMELARKLVDLLSTPRLRLYASADITGVQLGGAAKNVIAVAAGITIGAGLGENARAALITRGLAEITRLGVALGAQPATLAGLAGLGDLLLTCTGEASRNYQMGLALGRGNATQTALATLPGVAEGVTTADALLALAHQRKVDVPITACIAAFLEGRITLPQAQEQLLTRPLRTELDTPEHVAP
ncbi:glycerol-3-phosphate dehydrogenase [Acetobacter pasteurianus]|uniref:Glycerol-3-phosphate dehydrogenase [NAD(P)+] n=1 Tax=Acetobacter pasteurianus TaxID=438 RepID=A0A1A0D7N5_ACEPA|nr:NAD(P)H-dependent glycerol-3-phosphate dehydrogenase [Acetobacter pasteurianus]OAZ70821.1 Glycerol-3-phosphate dehydrogenase (NAD(P)(+)) [Acetobacter pasteurianus]RCL05659.1 glycerol-3-phosphate dehydrogenase [Acetobacter pasteurianus]GAB30051.1 glycerol-3-phosphate dehydrogenase [Acetobacter pasteurianus subsp. pasteurianus LMG 1262 = NBRC 106471]GCD48873.1 glycerol-3-phosphate dehydrogenase [Acetobacter pasteurianus subsp. pasteurianus LMG 1262 = NBRC 106471]